MEQVVQCKISDKVMDSLGEDQVMFAAFPLSMGLGVSCMIHTLLTTKFVEMFKDLLFLQSMELLQVDAERFVSSYQTIVQYLERDTHDFSTNESCSTMLRPLFDNHIRAKFFEAVECTRIRLVLNGNAKVAQGRPAYGWRHSGFGFFAYLFGLGSTLENVVGVVEKMEKETLLGPCGLLMKPPVPNASLKPHVDAFSLKDLETRTLEYVLQPEKQARDWRMQHGIQSLLHFTGGNTNGGQTESLNIDAVRFWLLLFFIDPEHGFFEKEAAFYCTTFDQPPGPVFYDFFSASFLVQFNDFLQFLYREHTKGLSLDSSLDLSLDSSLDSSLDLSLDSALDLSLDSSLDLSLDSSLDLSLDSALDLSGKAAHSNKFQLCVAALPLCDIQHLHRAMERERAKYPTFVEYIQNPVLRVSIKPDGNENIPFVALWNRGSIHGSRGWKKEPVALCRFSLILNIDTIRVLTSSQKLNQSRFLHRLFAVAELILTIRTLYQSDFSYLRLPFTSKTPLTDMFGVDVAPQYWFVAFIENDLPYADGPANREPLNELLLLPYFHEEYAEKEDILRMMTRLDLQLHFTREEVLTFLMQKKKKSKPRATPSSVPSSVSLKRKIDGSDSKSVTKGIILIASVFFAISSGRKRYENRTYALRLGYFALYLSKDKKAFREEFLRDHPEENFDGLIGSIKRVESKIVGVLHIQKVWKRDDVDYPTDLHATGPFTHLISYYALPKEEYISGHYKRGQQIYMKVNDTEVSDTLARLIP